MKLTFPLSVTSPVCVFNVVAVSGDAQGMTRVVTAKGEDSEDT